MNKNQPDIPLEGTAIKKVLTDTVDNYRESKLEREYKGFKKAIGRPDDIIGGDWYFRGALVKVNVKI